ncbi:tyrosine-type recombinase/integrase [Agriterribacter sp.]|uniref:tyrosine-type recombinase/integrase n=1 Tax=Agriterribacter sp. TaxID=2821509 RepID=UPI002C56D687|nr:tyrosine-type recombinase/integrase [Agriterribacter sp.]HTN06660.1 tyrosine-type recombinase/integrase [Agriterribacter sp.]
MTFTAYLQQKQYSKATVSRYTEGVENFLTWLHGEDIKPETFTYTELLDFMRYCQTKGISKRSVHNILCMVRHYCNYLTGEGKRTDNPAAGVFIKGLIRKLPTNLLSIEELEELYKQYSVQLNVDSSKKIMLGLMIYQGVTVGEIMRLQRHHFKLKDGKVFINGTKRTNERLLNLQAVQITELQSYLNANKFREGALFREQIKKPVSESNINNRLQYMFKQLKQLNPKVINAKQIRGSVITAWLRKNHLRQVQYMAGHKYVSSTMRYQANNLDDLKSELGQHHPMK